MISGTSVFLLASWNKFLSFLLSDSSVSPTKRSFPPCDQRHNIHIFQSGDRMIYTRCWVAVTGLFRNGRARRRRSSLQEERSKRSQKRWQTSVVVDSSQTVAHITQLLAVCMNMSPAVVVIVHLATSTHPGLDIYLRLWKHETNGLCICCYCFSVAKSRPTLCNLMNCSKPRSLSSTIFRSLSCV